MNDRILVETAVLAGEIMLISGADIYRVEDTVGRMLKKSGIREAEVLVLATGIFITLADPEGEMMSMVRRVSRRSTNLNRIYRVNSVSRQFCSGEITLEEAYTELKEIGGALQYSFWLRILGYILTPAGFALMFEGGFLEAAAAGAIGAVMGAVELFIRRVKLNDFCANAAEAFLAGAICLLLQSFIFPSLNTDAVIISDLMPLVPGVIFTSAIRDTLNGDYSSGIGRIMEAIVVALAVASGVGAAMLAGGVL